MSAESRNYIHYVQAIWTVVFLLLLCLGYFAWRNKDAEDEDSENEKAVLQSETQKASSSLRLIDSLVWSAFERQGYKMTGQTILEKPQGILRSIQKDNETLGLMCISNGMFCEQKSVEEVHAALESAKLKAGILVTAGNYTIPAQRLAKKYDISLIGRQQLIELLTIGATNEYILSQLAGSTKRLDEAKQIVKEYSDELDALRKQRNEASWYLGNERVRTAALEEQLSALQSKVKDFESKTVRWQEAAEQLRKSWEENQWYLGESQARVKHLEKQLDAVRGKLQIQEAPAVEPEPETVQAAAPVEVEPVNRLHERRLSKRAFLSDVHVEMRHSSSRIVFSGTPIDVSSSGMRVETDQQLPAEEPIHVSILLPGRKRRVVSMAKVMWQHADIDSPRYQSGCQLIGLSSASKSLLEQLAEKAEN